MILRRSIFNNFLSQSSSHLLITLRRFIKRHTTPKVLNHLEKNNIEAIIVPPRFTYLIQPADVIWFSLLKGAYHELWQKWFISNDHSYTNCNNMRSPGYVNCINWCVKLWDEFSSNLLRESFD